jgi:4-hydroxythreonine-4-phosphate dehydrogenase
MAAPGRADPLPRIGICAGEPAGIGPDLLVDIARDPVDAVIVAFGDPALLRDRARDLGVPLSIREVATPRAAHRHVPGALAVRPVPLPVPVQAGRPDPGNARAVLDALEDACHACLAGELDALVTGPVQKSVINDAGIPFTGHTEFLGRLCGTEPVMMLADDALRIVLATTHVPLRDVAAALTRERLTRVLDITLRDLRVRFDIAAPHLLVCGLNPHAGEQGHLGREEIEIIAPVLEELRATGARVAGPVPADTAFLPPALTGVDAVVTMYHDQGLPLLKARGFGGIVNITLGLPIVRTSVDHGTALPLAGTGRADAGSFRAALRSACRLARRAVA